MVRSLSLKGYFGGDLLSLTSESWACRMHLGQKNLFFWSLKKSIQKTTSESGRKDELFMKLSAAIYIMLKSRGLGAL